MTVTIEHRFRGPAKSGNGGYTAGSLAERIPTRRTPGTVEVTLRMPPPLETPMDVVPDGDTTMLRTGDAVVAQAREVDDELMPVEAVGPDVAADAMASYAGLRSHPFPGCFACGTDRAEGDGLQIYPGRVPGRADTVASLWVPHGSLAVQGDLVDAGVERVGVPTAWAALDCIGAWAGDMEERMMVLGRMTAVVDDLPVIGEPHVVTGEHRGGEGRRTFTASTLHDGDGRIVGRAEHVWFEVDRDWNQGTSGTIAVGAAA